MTRSRLDQLVRLAESRAARLYADGRRRLRGNRAVEPNALQGLPRADPQRWVDHAGSAHAAYRADVDPAAGSLAVICSSHRPDDLDNVLTSVGGQTYDDVELVFVAHGDGWDLGETEERLAILEPLLASVQLRVAPSSATLGACLNLAMSHTSARFVAKFDGDDRYGPEYLSDSLRAHRLADAGVVGKHSYYAHLLETDEYLLRFPGHEFQYTSTMSGGTFVIDREIVDDQHFADVSIGEDRDFIHRCHRRGISTYSGDRFNYTVVRSGANTWKIAEERFVESSIRYPSDWDPATIDR